MKKGKSFHVNILAIVLGTILVLYTILLLLILFYGLVNSLKDQLSFDVDPVFWSKELFDDLNLRKELSGDASLTWYNFGNYLQAFEAINMKVRKGTQVFQIFLPEMFLNSLIYAGGCAFFATLTPCLVAYVTSKYNFRFNSVIYMTVIFVMVTPIVGNAPSSILMAKTLGLFDSHIGLWFMSATFLGTYYLVFHGIFKSLSWEYAEAAFIDGASHMTVLFHVMLPLVKNTFFAVMMLNFIAYWNDYQRPWIYLPTIPTAAVGIQFCMDATENRNAGVPVKLAGGMLMLLPVLTLFLAFRDKFVGNLTVGGIKG